MFVVAFPFLVAAGGRAAQVGVVGAGGGDTRTQAHQVALGQVPFDGAVQGGQARHVPLVVGLVEHLQVDGFDVAVVVGEFDADVFADGEPGAFGEVGAAGGLGLFQAPPHGAFVDAHAAGGHLHVGPGHAAVQAQFHQGADGGRQQVLLLPPAPWP
ncbi:hypothetical protein [Streptomyces murinus]|uniref:hypothetical protein n=1 Tax=Streptomyces murinus TaxID=33900 RepID=UPI00380651F6